MTRLGTGGARLQSDNDQALPDSKICNITLHMVPN